MKKALFNDLMKGLEQARDYLDGKPTPGLQVHHVKVDRNAVAAVRIKSGLTQAELAKVLGASLGTVRKWESGERSPSGAAATLLRVLDYDAETVEKAFGFKKASTRSPRSQLVTA